LIVALPLTEILQKRLTELGVKDSYTAWAEFLDRMDRGTLSRILNGSMSLTRKRAEKWAALMFISDADQAAAFVERMLIAAQPTRLGQSGVQEFCEEVGKAGSVPAERVSDLLEALWSPLVERPLVCVDYRDIPRAGPNAKYERLGLVVAEAIARGVGFAMFQPFGVEIPGFDREAKHGETIHSFDARNHMLKIRRECRNTYSKYRRLALNKLIELEQEESKSESDQATYEKKINGRIRLFELKKGLPCLGSVFQAKLFYIEFSTTDPETQFTVRHQRVFQWVSTPSNDLLIYRGSHVDPLAIRDTLYPVPHFFHATGALAYPNFEAAEKSVHDLVGDEGLPQHYDIWKPHK
jgi:hypothetical protein